MKKIIAILLALTMVLMSLTACGKAKDKAESGASDLMSKTEEELSKAGDEFSKAGSDISEGLESHLPTEAPVTEPTFDWTKYTNTKKQAWGQGNNVNDKNQPESTLQYNDKYKDLDAYYIGTDESKVYITFDEGYENGYTGKMLDILKEKGVSAVFFCTYDYIKDNPDLIRRMIDEGHIVGNHTWKHPSMPTVSPDRAREEIMKLHNYVKENFDYEMTLFRFPMGEFSEQTLAIVKDCGYKSIFWSFAYADWDPDKQMDPEAAFKKISGKAHGGAIYLLHAVSKTNTEILGRVIDDIRSKGLTISNFDL